MPATYRAMMITRPGGPEVLQAVDLPVTEPGPGELRVRVRACGVGATDLTMLAGTYAFAPKLPLVGGYEIAGIVEAVGAGVTRLQVSGNASPPSPCMAALPNAWFEAPNISSRSPTRWRMSRLSAVILNYVTRVANDPSRGKRPRPARRRW